MSDVIDLRAVPEDQRAAYYGLLFALAAADGTFSNEEMKSIHSVLDMRGFSPPNLQRLRSYRLHPPNMTDCLVTLSEADDELRYGVLMTLVDVALADEVVEPAEAEALLEARVALCVDSSQLDAMKAFIRAAKKVGEAPDDEELQALKASATALAESGIPMSAAYFSATVNALNVSGNESAMAAIGLGLGFVPGESVAVLVGVTARVAVCDLLTKQRESSGRPRRSDRARQALIHLEKSINDLVERAESVGDEAEAEELRDRCEGLKQLMRTRRSALEEA